METTVQTTVQTTLYDLTRWADGLVASQLAAGSGGSFAIVLLAGLLTSLTPCMLSMLPIAVGYMGGYGDGKDSEGRSFSWGALGRSACFALGLATTLALLGMGAALFGRVYGQVGWGAPVVVSLVAIAMGLNLLEVLPLRFPALDRWLSVPEGVGGPARSYLVGLTFGLVASPCSTPVLATLLAWVSATGRPVLGGLLLLTYAIGYVSPLVLAGTFAATIKRLLALRQWGQWITPASGVVLIAFGVISLVNRLPFDRAGLL
jgi:cytochrome c-type biogenesis protein